MKLLENCARAYGSAKPLNRKRWNRAVFRAIYVIDKRISQVEYNEPFGSLSSESSSKAALVGSVGIEPAAGHVHGGSDLLPPFAVRDTDSSLAPCRNRRRIAARPCRGRVGAEKGVTTSADVVATYGSTWSEPDDAKRMQIIERCWAPDGVYCDPTARVEGREALGRHIAGFREQFAGHRIDASSGVDAHDGFLRFAWKMYGPDGNEVMEGIDFGRVNADGQLELIVGFFGPFPAQVQVS